MYSYKTIKTKKGFEIYSFKHYSNGVLYKLVFSEGKIKSRVKEIKNSQILEQQTVEKEFYDNRINELLTNYRFL